MATSASWHSLFVGVAAAIGDGDQWFVHGNATRIANHAAACPCGPVMKLNHSWPGSACQDSGNPFFGGLSLFPQTANPPPDRRLSPGQTGNRDAASRLPMVIQRVLPAIVMVLGTWHADALAGNRGLTYSGTADIEAIGEANRPEPTLSEGNILLEPIRG